MDFFNMTLNEMTANVLLENLFEEANKIKKLMPWIWMSEEMILVIEEPDSGRRGFVSILGQLGKHFAVIVYDEIEGYKSFIELSKEHKADRRNPLFIKKFFNQCALTVSFEDREDIADSDYELIMSLGLSFNGKKQWPRFRKLEKGCPEGFLANPDDIAFLSYCLSEACALINEIIAKKLDVPQDGRRFIGRFFIEDKIETLVKEIDTQAIASPFFYRQDIQIHKLNKLPIVNMVWEGIQYYLPSPIMDSKDEKVIYPYLTTFVNQKTGQVVFSYVGQNDDKLAYQLCEHFGSLLLDLKFKPTKLLFEDEVLVGSLSHFCEQIGIRYEVCQDVLEAKQFMTESFHSISMQLDALNDVVETFENSAKFDTLLDGLSEEEMQRLAKMLGNGESTQIAKMIRELGVDLDTDLDSDRFDK